MWVPRELESIGPEGTRIRRVARVEEALEGADVVHLLRVQQERLYEPPLSLDDYILLYQVTPARLKLAKPGALVMHPGPMNRGVELTPEVADGPQSCVLEQVTNGLAVRMALLFLLIGGAGEDSEDSAAQKKDSSHASH
jgi:aspartate carbamoyltransferase catalytic subunit